MNNASDRLRELEETVRILSQENQQLTDRAEDMLLLGLIAEALGQTQVRDKILQTGLEEISLLKDLPLCAFGVLRDGTLHIEASFLSFTVAGLNGRSFALPHPWQARIREGSICYDAQDGDFVRWTALLADLTFRPAALMIVPIRLQSQEQGLFLFANGSGMEALESLTLMLVRVTEMVVARLDHLYLLEALRHTNQELDRKVAARTEALSQLNATLRAELQERAGIESQLRASEARFRGTFEQAAVGICHADLEGRFIRVNQRFCDMVGYEARELCLLSFRQITHPDDLDADLANVERLLRGEESTFSMEKRYFRKDGTTCWVNLTVSLMRKATGESSEFIGVIEDLTQKRQVEERLRQAEKLEGIGQLAGGVAHDFNNLLTVIQGHVSLLLTDPGVDASAKEELRELEEAATRAATLTRQLLTFSRRRMLKVEVLDLNQILNDLLRMLRRVLSEQVILQFEPASEALWVKADQGMIEQVAVNLAVNARDAMPDGGTLTIKTRRFLPAPEFRERHPEARAGECVCLSFADTGLGMVLEVLAHVFEPFFTTKDVGQGTGLGLATVHGIVKQHQGWIDVQSQVGKGTTFEIYLPSCEQSRTADDSVGAEAVVRKTGETILLVEDEPSVRKMAGLSLHRLGYSVLTAATGAEALQLWQERGSEVALLFTDMVMPGGMSGLQLAERLCRLRPALPVIISSGYSVELHTRSTHPGTAFTYLAKPYTPRQLDEAVRGALRRES